MSRALLLLLFLWATPSRICGEIIYAVTASQQTWQIFWFDSEAPGEPLGSLPLYGDLDEYFAPRVEFDPFTHELYAFAVPSCQITCPPSPVDPLRIDLDSGETSLLDWPGFPSFQMIVHDIRIDPATREVRAIGSGNFRYSLNDLQLYVDQALDTSGTYSAIAHAPAGSVRAGETLAIYHPGYSYVDAYLARIGGVGGNPPASSGEVAVLGEIFGPELVTSFDISTRGIAFVLGPPAAYEPPHLYEFDLLTLETHDLGEVVQPAGTDFVYAIAAAPPGFGQGIVEVPTLSSLGLAALTLLIACDAVRRLSFR